MPIHQTKEHEQGKRVPCRRGRLHWRLAAATSSQCVRAHSRGAGLQWRRGPCRRGRGGHGRRHGRGTHTLTIDLCLQSRR